MTKATDEQCGGERVWLTTLLATYGITVSAEKAETCAAQSALEDANLKAGLPKRAARRRKRKPANPEGGQSRMRGKIRRTTTGPADTGKFFLSRIGPESRLEIAAASRPSKRWFPTLKPAEDAFQRNQQTF